MSFLKEKGKRRGERGKDENENRKVIWDQILFAFWLQIEGQGHGAVFDDGLFWRRLLHCNWPATSACLEKIPIGKGKEQLHTNGTILQWLIEDTKLFNDHTQSPNKFHILFCHLSHWDYSNPHPFQGECPPVHYRPIYLQ